ncbi:hypothetical protein YC2023_049054 [Brassica napus]
MEKKNLVSQDTLAMHKEKSDKPILQEKAKGNCNRAKIFTEQEIMNFTSQRFLSPSICEYPTLEDDSRPMKKWPEAKPIIGVKRILSAFQKAQASRRRSTSSYHAPATIGSGGSSFTQTCLIWSKPTLMSNSSFLFRSGTTSVPIKHPGRSQEDPRKALLSPQTVQVQEESSFSLGAKNP